MARSNRVGIDCGTNGAIMARPLDDDSVDGLSPAEAAARLAADGPNALPQAGRRSAFRIALEVLREPMLALLLIGGLAYLLLGNLAEALILLGFATFSVIVTIVQEARTERVLQALRDMSAPRALVIRGGQRITIPGSEVVHGDLMVIDQGDRIAADATLISTDDLQVDESLLTGESLPVGKIVSSPAADSDMSSCGEGQPYVYSGTLVTRGSGIARVTATGQRSEIGKIGQSLATLETDAPRLRRETTRIVKWCALGGGLTALLVVLLYGFLRGGWIEAVLAGIAIGMSLLPEEFPVVLTVFLAMGAWRIGTVSVLTRRASAIETLGSATVLCTDKTGTLTENSMSVAQVWLATGTSARFGAGSPPPAEFAPILHLARLASAREPSDPMEIALQLADEAKAVGESQDGAQVHAYALRPDLLAMSNVWQQPDSSLLVAGKGAPEAIADLCKLSRVQRKQMTDAVDAMAARGIRVLGVASAIAPDTHWSESQTGFSYSLIGLVGLADPLRPSARDAVAACRTAGIRVVMITGDYAATAKAIARDAGIADGDVLTGAELAELDEAQLAERMRTVSVFARIMPEQKLQIVQAFKAAGEVVAMTGDGVNDAPSLKAAHIGIAMGQRGTAVAREASAIVLLKDDFGAIVHAVALGRRIYDNIRKAMAFIFAVHVPIAALTLLPLLFGMPLLFGPIHIALLEMVIDPVCALVFEAERAEDDAMLRPPRDPNEPLFSWPMIVWSVFQGGAAFAMLGVVLLLETRSGMPEDELRALMFFALVAEILALILVNRSFGTSIRKAFTRHNAALRYVIAAIVLVTGLILLAPPLQELLKFGAIRWQDMGLAIGLGVALLVMLELCKPSVARIIASRKTVASDLVEEGFQQA
jgi:P-type Ca2+ transporter type 2C